VYVIHEKGDFEGNKSANGKTVQLSQCCCEVTSDAKTFY